MVLCHGQDLQQEVVLNLPPEFGFVFSWGHTGVFQLVSDFSHREFAHGLLLNWCVCGGNEWPRFSTLLSCYVQNSSSFHFHADYSNLSICFLFLVISSRFKFLVHNCSQ